MHGCNWARVPGRINGTLAAASTDAFAPDHKERIPP